VDLRRSKQERNREGQAETAESAHENLLLKKGASDEDDRNDQSDKDTKQTTTERVIGEKAK